MNTRLGSAFVGGKARDAREQCVFDKLNKPLKHTRLAWEMTIERRFGYANLARQRRGGNTRAGLCFEHLGKRLQYVVFA